MTERNPWWKAFLPKKKSGSKDHSIGPDYDPWAPRPEKPKEPAPSKTDATVAPGEQRDTTTDTTTDNALMDLMLNERAFNRNMNKSRSGRFKEKRRQRQSLPIQENVDSAASEERQ